MLEATDYGFISIIPIILTLGIAVWAQNVIIGLFIGVFSGVIILNGFNPVMTLSIMVSDYFVPQMLSPSQAGILVLMCFIGGLVALMERSGGAVAFATTMTHVITSRFKAQIATWMTGIMIFFSDLGTPLIVGPIYRPITDKLKISRVKLAWIVDTTASPVAVLIPFIGWGVYSMGLIEKEYLEIGRVENSFDAYMSAIPFQFYSLFAIIMVPLVAISGYEFGPMARAEKRAQEGKGLVDDSGMEISDTISHPNAKAIFVWLPLLVMVSVLFFLLVPLGFPLNSVPSLAFRGALSSAYFFSAMTLIALLLTYGVKSFKESITIYLGGISKMTSVLIILVLAWSLSSVGKNLGTAQFIISLAEGNFAPFLVPMIAFLFGAIMSFATGSSWGTYAIMMPLIIAVADALGAPMHVSIGAVLSGGMFGDHCSPISDTTILSASGAGCSQFDHVRTQLPYEMLNGSICVISYITAGLTESSFVFIPGMVLLGLSLYMMNKIAGVKIYNTSSVE
ncbi:MAG: Na+/H+ antiporter NhaC family protein [Emcibacteraceae bacterium]|nr:Na+/H+ antiporter NhaC family protein [Emcibacteraceae bacterium]MDG1726530.1 Na+/H+ antiporter NhaC family protein [Emcibacteraceae bacterium]